MSLHRAPLAAPPPALARTLRMELASPAKRRRQEGADDGESGALVHAGQAPEDLKRELRSAQMTLEKERLAHRREMRLLKLKLKKESEHNSSLRRRMEKLLSEEKELRGEVDSLRSQVEGLSESAEELKASLQRATTRADRAEQDSKVAQAELDTLRAQLRAYQEGNAEPGVGSEGEGEGESSSDVEIVDEGGVQVQEPSGDEGEFYSSEEEGGEGGEGGEEGGGYDEGEGAYDEEEEEEEEEEENHGQGSPRDTTEAEQERQGAAESVAAPVAPAAPSQGSREADLERQLSRAVADAADAKRRVRWLETHLDVQRERARAADMAEAKIQQLEEQLSREQEKNSQTAVVGVDADAATQQLDQAFSLVKQAVGEKDEEVKSVVGGVLVLRRLLQKERHEVELLAQAASEGKQALAGAQARARSAEEAAQQAQQAEMRARARAEDAEAASREAMRRASFHEHECASYKELADAYAAEAKSLREWAQRKPGQAQNTAAESGGESEVAGAQSKEVGLLRAKVERLSQEIERLEQQASAHSAGASHSGVVGDLQKQVTGLEAALSDERSKRARLEKQLEASEGQCARLEAAVGKGSFNPATTKVVHLARNPAREAREQWSNERTAELETLRTEVETLRAALAAAEQGHEEQQQQQQQQQAPASSAAATAATPAAATRTMSALRRAGATPGRAPPATPLTAAATALARAPSAMGAGDLQKRVDRLKQVFSDKIGTLREAVYLLTGYKVDMTTTDTKATRLRLRSMYAEHEEDHLLFQLEDGELQMLETEFTRQMDKRLFMYLTRCGSVPAFLSNVTLHLFDQQTINPGALAAAAAAAASQA